MRFLFITLFLISSQVYSQAPTDVTTTSESAEPMTDVQGPYVKPTPEQKARVHAAAKQAKKKQLKAKDLKKTKKTNKSTK